MDKKTFGENYGLSRGQVDRLVARGLKCGGVVELSGFGYFSVRKTGRAKTAAVEISPLAPDRAASRPTSGPAPELPGSGAAPDLGPLRLIGFENLAQIAALLQLTSAELTKLKTVAEIEKIQQATSRYRAEVRAEALAELLPLVSEALAQFRRELDQLRLPGDQLEALRQSLQRSLDRVAAVRLPDASE